MPTVKYAPHISDVRGSMGNTTYSRNRLGNYLKVRKPPLNRRSLEQLLRRQIHTLGVAHWRSINPPSLRVDWNDLALLTTWYNRAAIPYSPSGFNAFMRMYNFCKESGQAMDYDAPDAAAATPPTFEFAALEEDDVAVTVDNGWCTDKTGWLKFWLSPALSRAAYTFSGSWLETAWYDIDVVEAGLNNFKIFDCPPVDLPKQRLSVVAKAIFDSGAGHTVTWPQIENFEIQIPV